MRRPGQLIDRVAIQRATEARDSFGDPVATWSTSAQVWASVEYTGGSEAVTGNREYAVLPVIVWVRLSSQTRTLREKDRLLIPGAYTKLKEVLATTADTSVVVDDATVFPPENEFGVRVGSELMLVSAVSGNTLTATRGAFSTTAASHMAGASVIHTMPLDIVAVARHRGFLELTGLRSEVRLTA